MKYIYIHKLQNGRFIDSLFIYENKCVKCKSMFRFFSYENKEYIFNKNYAL